MRTTVATASAPAAIGPYSQAVVDGGRLHASGQIPLDPATGELAGESTAQQAHQVMRNLAAVLEAARCSWDDVIKTTIYLVDLDDFSEVNAIYGGYLREPYPARTTIQVAALPRGARIEIELVARTAE